MSDSDTASEEQEIQMDSEAEENDSDDSSDIDLNISDSDDENDDDGSDGKNDDADSDDENDDADSDDENDEADSDDKNDEADSDDEGDNVDSNDAENNSDDDDVQMKNIEKKNKSKDSGKKATQLNKKENGVKDVSNKTENKAHFYEGKKQVLEKYEKLRGKQLFVRFPQTLPKTPKETEEFVKTFNERIISVTRPRQKSVRHCLVQFDSEKDRAKAMQELKKVEIDGKKLIVGLPKTEDKEYLEKISNYQAKKHAKFMEMRKAQKLARQNHQKKNLTSTIIVSNIPSNATAADIKALFPEAVELRFTVAKGIENTSQATITLPSTLDASQAKRKKHKIGDNDLKIKYANELKLGNNKKSNKKLKSKKNKKQHNSAALVKTDKSQNNAPKNKNTPSSKIKNQEKISANEGKTKNENIKNKNVSKLKKNQEKDNKNELKNKNKVMEKKNKVLENKNKVIENKNKMQNKNKPMQGKNKGLQDKNKELQDKKKPMQNKAIKNKKSPVGGPKQNKKAKLN